jgi:hypothetical protein
METGSVRTYWITNVWILKNAKHSRKKSSSASISFVWKRERLLHWNFRWLYKYRNYGEMVSIKDSMLRQPNICHPMHNIQCRVLHSLASLEGIKSTSAPEDTGSSLHATWLAGLKSSWWAHYNMPSGGSSLLAELITTCLAGLKSSCWAHYNMPSGAQVFMLSSLQHA